MKIIIGLGNPGEKFTSTRHNVGFMIVDKIQENWNLSTWEFNKKFNSQIAKGNFNSQELLLVKPETFMNLSGDSVRAILDFYKLTPDDIIVIHDDLDITLGKYKIATDSTSAGHNGVQDIIDKIGTKKFIRLRVGIGQEKDGAIVCRLDAKDFVLQKFTQEELKTIEEVTIRVIEEIKIRTTDFH